MTMGLDVGLALGVERCERIEGKEDLGRIM